MGRFKKAEKFKITFNNGGVEIINAKSFLYDDGTITFYNGPIEYVREDIKSIEKVKL